MQKEIRAIEICGISYQKKLNIMRCFLGGKEISRNEVAEKCSLSEATAGKVATALCEQGILRIEKRPVGRGRRTEFFAPTEKLCGLVITVREESLSANLLDLCENVIIDVCRKQSLSISSEGVANDFCAELFSIIERMSENIFFKVGILFDEGISPKVREKFKATICRYFDVDVTLEYKSAKLSALCRLYPSEVLLVVGVNESLSLSLVCANRVLPKRKTRSVYTHSNDPNRLVEEISALVCPMFDAVFPDRILIESHTFLADRALRDALCERIAKATGIPKEELPIIESNANVDHAECEVLELLREKICIRLLGS